MSLFKRSVLFVLSAGIATTQLTGCTDEEVATSVGAAAIIGGAVLIGSNTQCQAGYQTKCHRVFDYWGRPRQECHSYYDSCARLVPRGSNANHRGHGRGPRALAVDSNGSVGLTAAQAVQAQSDVDLNLTEVNEIKWAQHFSIAKSAAHQFLTSMNSARKGNSSALLALGLLPDDIEKLADKKLPSDEGFERLAQSLNTSKNNVIAMVGHLIEVSNSSEFQEIQNSLVYNDDGSLM